MTVSVARVQRMGVLAAVVLGALSAWEGRFDMDPDGVSYLDVADAYGRGDWQNALNAVWSPLYSWILLFFLRVLRPDGSWEYPLVHGINFLLYLGALAAFAYCLRQLRAYRRWRAAGESQGPTDQMIPDWALYAAGYAVFVWGCVVAVRMNHVGPHIMLAALTFLITGLLLRLRMYPEDSRSWAALGLALGLAYLARAQTLVFVVLFFGLAVWRLLAVRRHPEGRLHPGGMALRPVLALGIFLVVASLYAVPLLALKGQFAGHDLVRLNYAWYVNGVPILHWQGDPPYGRPVHPTRILFEAPRVYEFDGPVGGTYPPWYDPSYWYKGVEPRFSLVGHLRRLRESLGTDSGLHSIPFSWSPGAFAYLLVVAVLMRRRLLPWGSWKEYAELQLPALVALGSYPILTILPERFLGAFLPLLWVGTIAGVSWPARRSQDGRIATAVVAGIVAFHLGLAAALAGAGAAKSVITPPLNAHWRIAEGLRDSGIPAGSKVAVMGRARHAHWARLARVRIVAEIRIRGGGVQEFWAASDGRKNELLTGLQTLGVRAVVVDPTARPNPGIAHRVGHRAWSEIKGTEYLVMVFR